MAAEPMNMETMVTFLNLLGPGLRELRIFDGDHRGTSSGYYQTADALAFDAMTRAAGGNCYVTLNPVMLDVLARSANRLTHFVKRGHTTKDCEIESDRFLYIDIDAVRATGISATDAELDAALALRDKISADLCGAGLVPMITTMSGNGGGLFYRLTEEAPSKERTVLKKQVLTALATRYDTDQAKVDTSVHNPARLVGLMGTTKCKGSDLPDRPHRVSHIDDANPDASVIDLAALLAHLGGNNPDAPQQADWGEAAEAVLTTLDDLGVEVLEVKEDDDRTVIEVVCPFNGEHNGGEAAVFLMPNRAKGFRCHHDSCADYSWRDFARQVGWPRNRRGAGLSPAELGQRYIEEHHVIACRGGQIYQYRDGVYRPGGEHALRLWVQGQAGRAARKNLGNEVAYWVSNERRVEDDQLNTGTLVNVANGLLDWQTGELGPHSPEHLSTIQLPTGWDPSAYHQRADEFLTEVLPDEETRWVLEELVGYCLLPDCPHQIAGMFTGTGENGKSLALGWLVDMLGFNNVATVRLQDLNHRFRGAALVGTLVNVAADLPQEALKDSGAFKALVAGDPMQFERKGKDPFNYCSRAKLFFSCNELPATPDRSPAFFRRWALFEFPNSFPPGTPGRDPRLGEKLREPAARSYLLRLAVEGLRRLEARGYFEKTPAMKRALEEYRRQVDNVALFVAEECQFSGEISKDTLYREYAEWANSNGLRPVAKPRFGRRLRAAVPVLSDGRRGPRGAQQWMWLGLSRVGDRHLSALPPLPSFDTDTDDIDFNG